MDAPEYTLQILAPAQRELEEIAQIHFKLVGLESAIKITNRIIDALARLKSSPEMGIRCKDKLFRLQGYRMLICGNYICFYRLKGETILVYHVADGRSDYPRHMTDLEQ